MYPSMSFVAAKMAPTAMQNPPEKQSKELSLAWLRQGAREEPKGESRGHQCVPWAETGKHSLLLLCPAGAPVKAA